MFCHLPAWPHGPGLESMIKNSFFSNQLLLKCWPPPGTPGFPFRPSQPFLIACRTVAPCARERFFQLGRAAVKELRTHFCHIPRMMAGRQAIYQTFDVRIKHLFQNRRQFLNGWALPGLLHSCLKIFPFWHTLLKFERRKNLVHHHLPSQMLL